jgi:glycosyltransferase involved in cell wall biosynthesis
MKILFISPLTPPFYGSAMSSEMCLDILLNDNRFDVENIKINYSNDMSDIGVFTPVKIIGFVKLCYNTIYSLLSNKPNLVYVVPATMGLGLVRDSILVFIVRLLFRDRIIVHLRSMIYNLDDVKYLSRKLTINLLNVSDVIVINDRIEKKIKEINEKANVHILLNAIVAKKNLIVSRNYDCKNPRILFLSNMIIEKRWDKVLDLCAKLKNNGKKFSCNFVGAWSNEYDKSKFHKYILENQLNDCVKHLGPLYDTDKERILSESDILLFTSEYKLETFGRVIVEAMEFGLVVISNDVGSAYSIIDNGVNGYILNNNSVDEMYDIIVNQINNNIYNNLSSNAVKKFRSNYTIDTFKDNFKRIILAES